MNELMNQALNEVEAESTDLAEQARKAPPAIRSVGGDYSSVINLVNQAYQMESLLHGFGYKKQGKAWLHPHSESGIAGVHVLTGRYYSHHNSDPLADGHTHDSFDVLVQWRFGGDMKRALKVLADELDPAGQQQRQRDYMNQNGKVLPMPAANDQPQPMPVIIPLKTDLPEVQKFDPDLLPKSLHGWITDIQERMQCPIDFLAIGALIGLAGLIGRKVGIYPKQFDDWMVICNLFGAMIGRPSIMKTPALNEILKPLNRLIKMAEDEYQQNKLDYEVERTSLEMRKKDAEKELAKAHKMTGPEAKDAVEVAKENLRAILEELEQAQPVERRFIVNDPTIEALGEKLNQNPNGLILVRDEITGWMKTLDRDDRPNDRAFILECFNGTGFYIYDRIGRGTLKIESLTLSIIGGIQPAKLMPYINGAVNGGSGDDGLLQRFQLAVYPDDNKAWQHIDRTPDHEAKDQAFELYQRLAEMPERRTQDGDIIGLHFDESAQPMFNQWWFDLENQIRADDIHPAVESHLAKYRSLIPSLALILELADNPQAQSVGVVALNKAIRWGEYLKSHMMRIYNGAIDSETIGAKKILDSRDKLPDEFKAKEVQQRQWTGLKTTKEVKAALSVLVEHGYLIEQINTLTGGRPSESYYWNPDCKKIRKALKATPLNHPKGFLQV